LDLEPDEVDRRLKRHTSLVALLDGPTGENRQLVPLRVDDGDPSTPIDPAIVDPDSPEEPSRFARRFFSDDVPEATRHPWIKAAIALVVLLALGVTWRWTPLSDWIQPEHLTHWMRVFADHPLAPLLVIGAFAVAGLLMLPLTALLVVVALTFDPLEGIVYSVFGSALSGLGGFAGGRIMTRNTIRRLAGSRLNRISQRLAKRGVLSVIAIRLLPVAPFTIVNLVVGASHVRCRDFLLGTVVGLLPGILTLNLFGANLADAIADPNLGTISSTLVVLVVAVLLLALLRRAMRTATELDD
jgi:uncharacterized membrane protein YdjX (TVP38/TMEM64 family)